MARNKMAAPICGSCRLFIRKRITEFLGNFQLNDKQYSLARNPLFENILCKRTLSSRYLVSDINVRKLVTLKPKHTRVAYNDQYLHNVLNTKYNEYSTRKTWINNPEIEKIEFTRNIHKDTHTSKSDKGFVKNTCAKSVKNHLTKVDEIHRKCLNGKCLKCSDSAHVAHNNDCVINDKLESKDDAWREQIKVLKEDIRTIPNLLTLSRVLAAPVLGYLVVHDHYAWACGIFIYAGISDVLDGYIARHFVNQQSVLGAAFDPLADKLLISVLVLSLTSAGLLPGLLTGLIIGRDVGLVAAGFYLRYLSLPQPKTIARYFDVTLPTAQLYPTNLSKVNTGLQLMLVALTLSAPVFDFINHPYLQALWYVTGTTTILSAIGYMIHGKECVRIIKESKS